MSVKKLALISHLRAVAAKNWLAMQFAALVVPAILFASFNNANAQAPLKEIKIATLKSSSQTPEYYAKKNGIYAKYGLDAVLTEFPNGNAAVSAGQSGAIDVMFAIPGIGMTAIQNGFGIAAILQQEIAHMTPPDTGSLQVLVNSNIKALADLKGKRIAVPSLSSQNTVSVQTILKKSWIKLQGLRDDRTAVPDDDQCHEGRPS